MYPHSGGLQFSATVLGMSHAAFMHRCLELAERGRGAVGINPMVGAVLVSYGTILAEGWHARFGESHAERELLQNLEQKISSSFDNAQDDTILYVNLEPCGHTNKKTPPCVDLLIERGIKHVVVGMIDPNPAVMGQGIARLRAAGVEVIAGIDRARCEWFNRGFSSVQRMGRPWITLKQAQTLDGRVHREDGSKLKITSSEQDTWSHTFLRARHDAIMAGVGTVTRDDPYLNTRFVQDAESIYHPLRIVLDPHLRIPLTAKVINGELASNTVILTFPDSSKAIRTTLHERGVRIFDIAEAADGSFVFADLWRVLTTPQQGFAGVTTVLLEGGPATWARFRVAEALDAEVTLVNDPIS